MISDLTFRQAQRRLRIFLTWVAALRSGYYRQGKGKLTQYNADGVRLDCCLGVVCDLTIPVGDRELRPNLDADGDPVDGKMVAYDGTSGVLPGSIVDDLGFYSPSGDLRDDGGKQIIEARRGETLSLIGLNDEDEFTFNQIADILEYAYVAPLVQYLSEYGSLSSEHPVESVFVR